MSHSRWNSLCFCEANIDRMSDPVYSTIKFQYNFYKNILGLFPRNYTEFLPHIRNKFFVTDTLDINKTKAFCLIIKLQRIIWHYFENILL